MRNILVFILTGLLALTSSEAMAQKLKVVPRIYAFGFSASFNDSVIYITDIQEIDSVWVKSKNEFLVSRNNYSYQLRDYLANKKHEEDRTCVMIYAFKKKDIEKKYVKLKQRYTKKGDFDVKYLTMNDFRFERIEVQNTDSDDEVAETPKKKKGGKKK